MPRFAELGVIANLEPLWAQLDPLQVDLTLPRLGPPARDAGSTRWPRCSPPARVLSMGSDWPVSSYRPLEGLAVAVTRQTQDGVPGRRLGARTSGCRSGAALSAYTQGVAYQAFEEDGLGHADGRPPRRPGLAGPRTPRPPSRRGWPEIAVRGTWLAGRRTWDADAA